MQRVSGDVCWARSTVHKWFKRFQNGRKGFPNNEGPGGPQGNC